MRETKVRRRVGAALLTAAVAALLATGVQAAPGSGAPAAAPAYSYTPGPVEPVVALDRLRKDWVTAQQATLPPKVQVKGIYLTAYSAKNPKTFGELVGLVDRTELNAMVINVKDDWGYITIDMDHPLAQAAGAIDPQFKDGKEFTAFLRSKGIYSIARVVTFKDSFVPKYRPEMATASTRGGIWRDYNEVSWLNPYDKGAWDYLVKVGKAAALAGFDEIQFDYVRFPTDGNMSLLTYPGKDSREQMQVIADFLTYARKELRPYGVWVSADVFGLVTSLYDDLGIGQHLEEISEGVDIISPMVYPSHYIPGNLGLSSPNAMPYETVYRSMLDAKGRWEKAGQTGKVVMRPWLQDFSWGHPYGPKEVRDQIQATYDAGYNEWILWNAANVYTEAALKPAGQQ